MPLHLRRWSVIIAVVLLATVALAAWRPWRGAPAESVGDERTDDKARGIVRLSASKLAAANLHVEPIAVHELQELRTVPGRITYNTSKRLELNAPAAGVVKKVFVGPGQAVKSGDSLIVLTSSDIGLARDEVAQCEADLKLAVKEHEWSSQITENLDDLLVELKLRPKIVDVEKAFADRVLGDHRDKLMGAYSKLLLAEAVTADTRPLTERGVLSGRIAQERRSSLEVAGATFSSVGEQSKFDAARRRDRTKAAVEHAERMLAISRQRLRTLCGPFSELTAADDGSSSDVVLKAPFDGVIDERHTVEAARVAGGDPLFVLANTDTVWVSAEVHERDWAMVGSVSNGVVMVTNPSLDAPPVPAKVAFISGKVTPETRSVPLVAELDNAQHLYKPGMFVWVALPAGKPHERLAVRPAAIARTRTTDVCVRAIGEGCVSSASTSNSASKHPIGSRSSKG